jgi:hypothetical protein
MQAGGASESRAVIPNYEVLAALGGNGRVIAGRKCGAVSVGLASRAQFIEQYCQDDHGALDNQLPVEGHIHQG